MTAAAVDIGTNSVRLLVRGDDGREIVRLMRITRLGQGVDSTGRLAPAAIERTAAVMREYAGIIGRHGATAVRATATSAARDAGNAAEFRQLMDEILGRPIEVVSGEEEAALGFAGAVADLDAALGPFLVTDIGGGSTEFVYGTGAPEALCSVRIGCVRISERFLHRDPPSAAEIAAAVDAIDDTLETVRGRVPVDGVRTLVGLAGTVTSIAAIAAGCTTYDPSRTHHLVMQRDRVEAICADLAAARVSARRGMLLDPERADVVVGGALVLVRIMRRFGFDSVIASEHDSLDGLAASAARSAP